MKTNAKERLLKAGTVLFAQNGYGSTSIRAICEEAGVGINMVHHYFGNKEGLHKAILESFSSKVLVLPLKVIDADPETQEEVKIRLKMFVDEVLDGIIEFADIFRIFMVERQGIPAVATYEEGLVTFLEKCRAKGFIREGLDLPMVTGFILDRLAAQVYYSDIIKGNTGVNVIENKDYRDRWVNANLDLMLHGMLS
ncbi:TetR/AcrR family transcriptional regulator [Flexibacterium corallicola]|uniref:TetR/AcrR family transcriptional regulator n=1 Tax=Flexibacterium corallicola TaxID=3037259 RepID=UPI00286F43C7|nr:TetR/AcrR family transcriptional regulator [Pseudovibrio sp. M1P-2-3]